MKLMLWCAVLIIVIFAFHAAAITRYAEHLDVTPAPAATLRRARLPGGNCRLPKTQVYACVYASPHTRTRAREK
jgi:hypothetical protein